MMGEMERAAAELERRSRYMSSLIQKQRGRSSHHEAAAAAAGEEVVVVVEEEKAAAAVTGVVRELPKEQRRQQQKKEDGDADRGGGVGTREQENRLRVRAAEMPPELQKRAFRCAREALASMPRLDSKRLALTLKKEFDSSYGPAWHCIVGTSFGSYVTHSLGGFLYFSIDKVYILLFKTAVEPLGQ